MLVLVHNAIHLIVFPQSMPAVELNASVIILLHALHPWFFHPTDDQTASWYRCMLMAPPLCPLMREKQALENSMVSFLVSNWLQFSSRTSSYWWYLTRHIMCPAFIYPSLLQLQRGVTDSEDKKQKAVCMERYRRRDEEEHENCSEVNIEGEEECGICMEMKSKVVLPNCNHAMCLKCYREW